MAPIRPYTLSILTNDDGDTYIQAVDPDTIQFERTPFYDGTTMTFRRANVRPAVHLTPDADFPTRMEAYGLEDELNAHLATVVRRLVDDTDDCPTGAGVRMRLQEWADGIDPHFRPDGAVEMEARLAEANDELELGLDPDELTDMADHVASAISPLQSRVNALEDELGLERTTWH